MLTLHRLHTTDVNTSRPSLTWGLQTLQRDVPSKTLPRFAISMFSGLGLAEHRMVVELQEGEHGRAQNVNAVWTWSRCPTCKTEGQQTSWNWSQNLQKRNPFQSETATKNLYHFSTLNIKNPTLLTEMVTKNKINFRKMLIQKLPETLQIPIHFFSERT